ncbi:MAG TPA: SpoIIE family protein phosphatase [Terriglobales bacterium]|nr:SpoIIE family protein phosphatase [Terriglobales bacterium]
METLMMNVGSATHLATARLLVADDQPHILTALELLLHGEGYQTNCAVNPDKVLEALRGEQFDVVLMDLNYTRDTTGGAEGLELVSQIRLIDQNIPLVVMTAWGNVDLAVEAMRRGASDFVQKPWNNHQLLGRVREQVERGRGLRSSQRRIEEESQEARTIQKNLLPSSIPQIAGYDISAITQPMHFVGGDYYNVEKINETLTAFCIADVAGKGLPGALLMSNLQASLKPLIRAEIEPQELCNRLNRILCEIMPENKFISFFYGVLDSQNNRFTYCNAGHNPPIVLRSDGNTSELDSSGAILGKFPHWEYVPMSLGLCSGDTLLLFTDGVVEACDSQNEPFGEQRLMQAGQNFSDIKAAEIQIALLNAVSNHCGRQFQDDATMIVLKVNAKSL